MIPNYETDYETQKTTRKNKYLKIKNMQICVIVLNCRICSERKFNETDTKTIDNTL